MHKKRLIFTLLYGDGLYNLSRNFTLQRVGDISWIWENYEFDSIIRSIDELILLDVSRDNRNREAFTQQIRLLGKHCFMPLAAGGGIDSMKVAYRLFDAGADKLILNTAYFDKPNFVRELSKTFGTQSIVASLDFRQLDDGSRVVYTANASRDTGMSIPEAIKHVEKIGAGEIYITSVGCEGIGAGYDFEAITEAVNVCSIPVIASGGAGIPSHFTQALTECGAQACSTANLFNFMGDGLEEARSMMRDENIMLAHWPSF